MDCLLWMIPFSIFYRVSCRVSMLQIFFKLDRQMQVLAQISRNMVSALTTGRLLALKQALGVIFGESIQPRGKGTENVPTLPSLLRQNHNESYFLDSPVIGSQDARFS
jgi:hypothetical protein